MESPSKKRIAYIMSRFPKISETFVLYEILSLEKLGWSVEVFPLLRVKQEVEHREAAEITSRAHFHPFLSLEILKAQLHYLWRKPRVYFGALWEVLCGTWGSANFFFGALGIFPKTVRFAYEMQELGVQHVHAHFASHPAVAALIVHRLTGIPYSFTAHGSDLHVERRMLKEKVAAAAFAVTVSRYNRELILRECNGSSDDKVHVVHCGVETDLFGGSPGSGRSRNGHPLHVLCVASFEEVKGHRVLIDAVRILAERGVGFTLDLVGDGPKRTAIEQQIDQYRLGDRVRVHGPKPRHEVVRFFGQADVLVLASVPTSNGKREGIPVVLMEAMAARVPVVSSVLSGIPELVDDGRSGVLVRPGDAIGLADALQGLAADPRKREAMGDAGRKKVIHEFDLVKNTKLLADLFEKSTLSVASDPRS